MRYIIDRNSAGQYYWVLRAANGRIIAVSEAYVTKASCRASITVITGLPLDRFFVYQDTAKEWRWYAQALNNERVGHASEGYKNKADCEAAARLVHSTTSLTPVEDLTLPAGAMR